VELLPILHVFARRKIVIGLGVLAAIALGAVIGGGPVLRAGVASTRLVFDTPESQLVFADPRSSDELLSRTVLLSQAVTTNEAERRIASRLGVPVDELVIVDALFVAPAEPTTLPTAAADAALTRPERYSVIVRNDDFLPIITLEAHAPDRTAAVKLIAATKQVLLSPGGGSADNSRRFELAEQDPPTRAREVVDDSGYVKALGVGLAFLGLWCAGVALLPGLGRGARRPISASA